MLGPPKRRVLNHPIGHSLEELVPQDHFYRFVDAKLDLSFVRAWAADCYAAGGRPSIDPVVFFKLQLVCSSRASAPSVSSCGWSPTASAYAGISAMPSTSRCPTIPA